MAAKTFRVASILQTVIEVEIIDGYGGAAELEPEWAGAVDAVRRGWDGGGRLAIGAADLMAVDALLLDVCNYMDDLVEHGHGAGLNRRHVNAMTALWQSVRAAAYAA